MKSFRGHLQLTHERAFTLVELLVVILVIGILIAVAAPSFLGQTSKAQDSVVQQQLTVSLTEAQAVWTSAGQSGFPATGPLSDPNSLVGQMQASEPGYHYAVGPGAATVTTTDVTEPDASGSYGGNAVTLCQQSGSGTFFCVEDSETGGLTLLADVHSSLLDKLLGVGTAYAAGTTTVNYSTGATEADARAVFLSSSSSAIDTGPGATGRAGWNNPASSSSSSGGTGNAPGLEVAMNTQYGGLSVNQTDGTQLTSLSPGAVATDQRGNVYTPDSAGTGILRSAAGASPVPFISNVCSGTDVVAGLAFTPDGSKGAFLCIPPYSSWSWYEGKPYHNGQIRFWNGTSTSTIYTGQGAFSAWTVQIALSPDGGTLVYAAVDETVAAFQAALAGGADHRTTDNLYSINTGGGAPTLLDSTTPTHAIANFDDSFNGSNDLAFTNNGADVVYDVSPVEHTTNTDITNSIWQVAVSGGTPTELVPHSGTSSWRVLGSSDLGGNSFACQQITDTSNWDDTSVLQSGICDSSGALAASPSALTTPAAAHSLIVGYSANIGGSGGTGGSGGSGGTGGTGGTGGSGGTGGTGGTGGSGICNDSSVGAGASGSTDMEVLIDASTRDICIADSNGSGLTDLYDLSSLWSYHAVVNDQVGDVYIADNNDDILKSVNGATPTTFLVNVCGNNPMTGTGSGYTLQGMAFTPDGSKGAWFCQDNAAYPHGNGYISFWDGLIVNTIYTAQGATSPPVNDVNSVRSMALSADGSTLVYETTDESTSAYAGDSGATHTMLYEIATNVVTATGAATVLDAGSGNNIGAYDGFGNALAFTNGGADVVYDVSTDNAATNSIWKVPVNGSGSPAQLVAPSGSDSWSVVGADDSAGNGFACQKENSSYITLQLRLCASDGTPGTTLPLPNTASGESPVGYSSTR